LLEKNFEFYYNIYTANGNRKIAEMKIVRISAKQKVEIVEVPIPPAKKRFVLVKIHSIPMCTEYKDYYRGRMSNPFGHEAAGEVVDIEESDKVKIGDRVIPMFFLPCGRCNLCLNGDYIYCNHQLDFFEETGSKLGESTYAEFMLKPDWLLLPIPNNLTYDHASLACCGLGPTFGAMKRLSIEAGDTVLITGLGPVGLGGIINARYRGANVIGVEKVPYRRQLAKQLGASIVDGNNRVLNHIMEITHGSGVDYAIECTGVPKLQRFALDSLRIKGEAAFIGWGGKPSIDIANVVIKKGLTLHGVWHWNMSFASEIMDLITQSSDLLDLLITHTFPLNQVEKAFTTQLSGECGKIILHP